jgi:hypothetical protein
MVMLGLVVSAVITFCSAARSLVGLASSALTTPD